MPRARYSTYRGAWPTLLAPLRVWKQGELGGGRQGRAGGPAARRLSTPPNLLTVNLFG